MSRELSEKTKKEINCDNEKYIPLSKVFGSLTSKKEYNVASNFGKNKYIMDYGCGPGYGSAILSKKATKVLGVDIYRKPLDYAKKTYNNIPNLSFQKISPKLPLPFNDQTFDVIVSRHVIEHITNVQNSLYELKRILKKGGILIIMTPNRKFRLLPFQKPFHKDHVKEYSLRSLEKELHKQFEQLDIKGVYGTDEINAIEHYKMKALKNPFKAYIYDPLLYILNIILPNQIIAFLTNFEKKFVLKIKEAKLVPDISIKIENRFNLDDCIIGDNLKNSIDFFAICKK